MNWPTVFRAWCKAGAEAKEYRARLLDGDYLPSSKFRALLELGVRRERQEIRFWIWMVRHSG